MCLPCGPSFAPTKIGLTETKLGIFPRAGGTQRLARLVIFHRTRLTAHQVLECDTHATFHPTRPQLICRDNRLRFRGGETGLDCPLQLAGGISVDGPLAVWAAKQAISRLTEFPFETGLEFDRTSWVVASRGGWTRGLGSI